MSRYMVTSALPYANGPLHLGHLAGAYLPADIYVRYMRMCGNDVLFCSGTDEHGVPITITAEKLGITPMQAVDKFHTIIAGDFEKFGISFDNFSRTTRPEHIEFAQSVFLDLLGKGHIVPKDMKQLYCPDCKRYLPDRYISGTCPKKMPAVISARAAAHGQSLLSLLNQDAVSAVQHRKPGTPDTGSCFLTIFSSGLKGGLEVSLTGRLMC